MTPKETAERLFKRYIYIMGYYHEQDAKKYALITVDEIIDAIDCHEPEVPNSQLEYWLEVQEEIESL
jgi:hypothetical protein